MARYRVTSEKGVYRAGEGYFGLDAEFTAPDSEIPPVCVIPLDEAAAAAYEKKYGKKVELPKGVVVKKKVDGKPIEEVLEPKATGKRTADE